MGAIAISGAAASKTFEGINGTVRRNLDDRGARCYKALFTNSQSLGRHDIFSGG
jgi:hypothetical protein